MHFLDWYRITTLFSFPSGITMQCGKVQRQSSGAITLCLVHSAAQAGLHDAVVKLSILRSGRSYQQYPRISLSDLPFIEIYNFLQRHTKLLLLAKKPHEEAVGEDRAVKYYCDAIVTVA